MMSLKYANLLSPIEINGVMLRNRLICTASNPHFIQATEKWPTEALISHYANKAKAGAAVVTVKGNNPVKTNDPHSLTLDITVGQHQHMFAQCADMVHYYGAKAFYLVLPDMNIVKGYDASDGVLSEFVAGDGSKAELGKAAPKELLYQMVEKYAEEAKLAQSLGFDGCFMHMAYRLMFPGRFLSPLSNKRTDEFGGSIENRARFPLMICEAIKKACGKNFLVEISISGREDDLFEGGATVEDQIELAKLLDCHMIRSLVFSKQACLWGAGGAEFRNGYNNKSWPKMLRLFEPLVQMAEDADMDIVFETGVNTVLTSGWLNRKFVEDMGSKHLKIIWDPANMLINREYPPEVYEEIKDLIGHVHIKDGIYDANRSTITATAVGQGDMKRYMEDIAKWLKRDGYDGVVSIENFYIPEGKTTEEGYLAGVNEFKRIFG